MKDLKFKIAMLLIIIVIILVVKIFLLNPIIKGSLINKTTTQNDVVATINKQDVTEQDINAYLRIYYDKAIDDYKTDLILENIAKQLKVDISDVETLANKYAEEEVVDGLSTTKQVMRIKQKRNLIRERLLDYYTNKVEVSDEEYTKSDAVIVYDLVQIRTGDNNQVKNIESQLKVNMTTDDIRKAFKDNIVTQAFASTNQIKLLSTKSKGYTWIENNDVYFFLGKRIDENLTKDRIKREKAMKLLNEDIQTNTQKLEVKYK